MWEASEEVPYAYKGNEWLGYDNTRSFKVKVDCVLWTVVARDFVPIYSPWSPKLTLMSELHWTFL